MLLRQRQAIFPFFVLLMMVVFAGPAVWAKPISGQELATTTQLKLTVQPSVSFTMIVGGHEISQDAAVFQLYRTSKNDTPRLIWTVAKTPLPGAPPKTWLGNICADAQTGQLYIAVSDGDSLAIYVTDVHAVATPIPLKEQWTLADSTSSPSPVPEVIGLPAKSLAELGTIHHMSLVKKDKTLIVALDTGANLQTRWSYSLTRREWRSLPTP